MVVKLQSTEVWVCSLCGKENKISIDICPCVFSSKIPEDSKAELLDIILKNNKNKT